MMAFFLVLYVLEGLGMMALAVPFIQRRVGQNRLHGFRLPETLGDEATWYRVNEAAGRWLFGVGLGFALFAGGMYLLPGIHDAHGAGVVGAMIIYNSLCTVVLFAGLFAAIAAGRRAL